MYNDSKWNEAEIKKLNRCDSFSTMISIMIEHWICGKFHYVFDTVAAFVTAHISHRKLTYVGSCIETVDVFFSFFRLLLLAYLHSLVYIFHSKYLVYRLRAISSCQFFVPPFRDVFCLLFLSFAEFLSLILIYCYLDTEVFNFFFAFRRSFVFHTFKSPWRYQNGMGEVSFFLSSSVRFLLFSSPVWILPKNIFDQNFWYAFTVRYIRLFILCCSVEFKS